MKGEQVSIISPRLSCPRGELGELGLGETIPGNSLLHASYLKVEFCNTKGTTYLYYLLTYHKRYYQHYLLITIILHS